MDDKTLDKILFVLYASFIGLSLSLLQFYNTNWKEIINIALTIMAVISFLISMKDYFKKG